MTRDRFALNFDALPQHRKAWILQLVDTFHHIHSGRYVYDNMRYTTMPASITPYCPVHGEFKVQARAHIQGAPCPGCDPRRVSVEVAISRFRETHGNKFDYSKVQERYVTFTHPAVEVICSKHGSFLVKPNNHWKTEKGVGCNGCRIDNRKLSREEIIRRITAAGQGHLIPEDFVYSGALSRTRVVCPRHGEFYAFPVNLQRGHGCTHCSRASSDEEEAWIDAIAKHLRGWKVHRGFRLKGVSSPVDAAFYSPQGVCVVVEYDGSYWHGIDGAYEKDVRKTVAIKKSGAKVIRLRALQPHKKRLKQIPAADANFSVGHKGPYTESKAISDKMKMLGEKK